MSEPKDLLTQLAKLQDKPQRSVRDLAVLEAAKTKAATVRQKNEALKGKPSFDKPSSFANFLSKPLWLGTGSLAAAVLTVFVFFGHQVEPETKIASAPVAEAVATAPSPAPVSAPPAAVAKKEIPVAKADKALTKSETKQAVPKKNADTQAPIAKPALPTAVAIAESVASPPPAPAPASSSSPIALASPMPSAVLPVPVQSAPAPSVPAPVTTQAEPVPNSKLAAMAAAPSGDTMARRRESASSFNTMGTCISDIKAVPLEKQSLSIELTKQLLERCSRSIPRANWPNDIDWAKKLLDEQPEKTLLKPTDKPQ